MLLKNKYVLRTVADKTVAIAAGEGENEGVITLNDTGAFIFAKLNDGLDADAVADAFFKEYDVTLDEAKKAVEAFIGNLKEADLLA